MGRHSKEQNPENRHQDLCSQLNAIGWGTKTLESGECSYTSIFSREPNRVGVVKEVSDSRTSRLKPRDFRVALQGIDMDDIHIHRRTRIDLPHWVEAFSLEALEAVAYKLGQLQPEPDTGSHFTATETK